MTGYVYISIHLSEALFSERSCTPDFSSPASLCITFTEQISRATSCNAYKVDKILTGKLNTPGLLPKKSFMQMQI